MPKTVQDHRFARRRKGFNKVVPGRPMVLVRIETPLRATEDPLKVKAAIQNLWPEARIEEGQGTLVATTDDLRPLRRRVWELRIIDTVRGQLLHGLAPDGKSLTARFSKQAALAEKVSFPPTPHALGDLVCTMTVESGDPWPDAEDLAWWLAPETKDGEIVGPAQP
jgi:uncharacterized protein